MKCKHPDRKLTLRQAYEKHYRIPKSFETQRLYKYQLKFWEKLSNNPPIGEITAETFEDFKEAALEAGYSPYTIATTRTLIKAILRRTGPAVTGNPLGLGILEKIPGLLPVRCPRKIKNMVSEEDLNSFYLNCSKVEVPKMSGFPAAWWWPALMVVCYCTGLRKFDLFNIKLEDIDLDKQTLIVTARKTGTQDRFPLHPVAVLHIKRLMYPREYLFQGVGNPKPFRRFYKHWDRIFEHVKSETKFTLQSIRLTAASKAEKVRNGAGSILLQHARHDVTSRHYLDLSEILADVVENLDIPLCFKHGVGMSIRAEEKKCKESKERQRLHPSKFALPSKPDPSEFKFQIDSFWLRGRWFTLGGDGWRVLKVLAESAEPVSIEKLADVVYCERERPSEEYRVRCRISAIISDLRKKLRNALFLDDQWNPVPCTERGNGGKWTLYFPAAIDAGKGEV